VWGVLGGRTGQVEQALVLLVGLVEHGGEAGNVLAGVPFPLLGGVARLLELVTQDLDLFTEDVYEGVCRRL
jgi:hypothetical protein